MQIFGLSGWALALSWIHFACASPTSIGDPAATSGTSSGLLPVDCLLPGQVRKLGSRATFVTPRRPIKTTAAQCEIRGGEYVAYDRADATTSLRVWLPAAEAGDAKAQTYVGEILEKGAGTAPDYERAAQWYEIAAAQGHARAQINLGALYESGLGVPRDPARARALYESASDLGKRGIRFVPAAPPRENAEVTRELQARIEALEQELSAAVLEQNARDQSLTAESERLARENRAMEARAEALRAEEARLISLQRKLEADRENAARMGTELDTDSLALIDQAEELEAKQHQIAAAAAGIEEQRALALEEQARLRQREEALQTEKVALDRKKAAIAVLAAQHRAKNADVQAANPEPVAGPTIQLVDPPLPPTRGIQIAPAMPAGARTVIGRASAPGGLVAVLFNGESIPSDRDGFFQHTVSVPASGFDVVISAVDRQGKRAERSFRLSSRTPAAPPKPRRPSLELGRFYALVIGNDDYQNLPKLQTARRDAQEIAAVLRTDYGIDTKVLLDANRYQILSALNELRAQLGETDNLLVYYAGHGELDRANARGHWLPVDSERESTANWISNVAVTDILNAMTARHILVIADSCYSGTLTRAAMSQIEGGSSDEARDLWIRSIASKRSRTALTSGGLEPVLDVGGGEHSVFARVLLEVLRGNDEIMEGQRLFQEVAARVTWAASNARFEQAPQYAPIKYAGHEAGDFLFVPRR